jgi:ATP-dependent RNA helicase RhlE
VPEQYVHRIGRTARAGADGIAIAFCSPEERGLLRDIERTTRQRIPVAPLPADFTASAEAFKRLKPAPKKAPQIDRAHRPATKADRRHDGQQRRNRNTGQQRHSASRSETQDRNGQRRDDRSQQRHDGHSSYRPEAYREAQPEHRADRRERHPHRADGHGAHRPEGGQPKRKFRGRRRLGSTRAA